MYLSYLLNVFVLFKRLKKYVFQYHIMKVQRREGEYIKRQPAKARKGIWMVFLDIFDEIAKCIRLFL